MVEHDIEPGQVRQWHRPEDLEEYGKCLMVLRLTPSSGVIILQEGVVSEWDLESISEWSKRV